MLIGLRNSILGKRLPYDAELEYLESTGTQWISVSSFVPDIYDDLRIVARFRLMEWTESAGLFGNYCVGESDNVCRWICQTTNNNNGWVSANTSAGGASAAVPLVVGEMYNIVMNCSTREVTLNGNTYLCLNNRGLKRHGTMTIFSSRAQGAPIGSPFSRTSKSRFYSLTAYNGAEPICDLVPVLDLSRTPCIYDRVSGSFFYNVGTGTDAFIIGPDKARFNLP